jgi:hypothetical protein
VNVPQEFGAKTTVSAQLEPGTITEQLPEYLNCDDVDVTEEISKFAVASAALDIVKVFDALSVPACWSEKSSLLEDIDNFASTPLPESATDAGEEAAL